VIIGEGDIDNQIRYAIRCVCGEDQVIKKVTIDPWNPDPFPNV